MTTWTKRESPGGGSGSDAWGGSWGDSWGGSWGFGGSVWAQRSAPSTTVWLEGIVVFKQRSDDFYEGAQRQGFIGGLVTVKRSDDFFELAGASYPGLYILGTRPDNFVENVLR